MTRDWDDDDDPDDWPQDDDSSVVTCPNCGADVYEDAEQCPSCGEWIEHSTHPFAGRSMWFIVLGVLGIAVTITALVLAGF
ncbi:MAG: zinc-ribbon domain-containing protein [Planctomycetaceae bacterium]